MSKMKGTGVFDGITAEFVEVNAEIAKDVLGFTVLEKDSKEEPHCRVKLYDEETDKLVSKPVRLTNCEDNRPIRGSIFNRYSNEILRRKWKFNGESCIVDSNKMTVSLQHRFLAVIVAEQLRLAGDELAKKYKWKEEVSIPVLLVIGTDPTTADTVDQGTGRTGADVLFRSRQFPKQYSEKEQKTLSKMLAGAARLVWLRIGGKQVSDAPKFMHSEMLDFIKAHPYLKNCCRFILDENSDDSGIKERISLGYAAGLMYLMAFSNWDGKSKRPDEETAELAEKFWQNFARGSKDRGNPARELWEAYGRMLAAGTRDRDQIIQTAVKAWIAFSEGQELDGKSIKPKKGEEPRCGGFDVALEEEIEEPEEEEVAEEEEEEKPKRRRRRRRKAQEQEPEADVESAEEVSEEVTEEELVAAE